VQRDRRPDRFRRGRGQSDVLCDVTGHPGAAQGEVDLADSSGQPDLVQQRGGEQQLTVEHQVLQRAQGGAEGEGAVGVVEQRRAQPTVRLHLGGAGQRRARRQQLRGHDLRAAPGVDLDQHQQAAGRIDGEALRERAKQRAALSRRQLSSGAIDPAECSETCRRPSHGISFRQAADFVRLPRAAVGDVGRQYPVPASLLRAAPRPLGGGLRRRRRRTPGLRRVPGLSCLSGMRVIGRNRTVDGRGHAT
jgi:hypothetical protein